jgi:hypothetical protein
MYERQSPVTDGNVADGVIDGHRWRGDIET